MMAWILPILRGYRASLPAIGIPKGLKLAVLHRAVGFATCLRIKNRYSRRKAVFCKSKKQYQTDFLRLKPTKPAKAEPNSHITAIAGSGTEDEMTSAETSSSPL